MEAAGIAAVEAAEAAVAEGAVAEASADAAVVEAAVAEAAVVGRESHAVMWGCDVWLQEEGGGEQTETVKVESSDVAIDITPCDPTPSPSLAQRQRAHTLVLLCQMRRNARRTLHGTR